MNDDELVQAWIRYQKQDHPAKDDPDWSAVDHCMDLLYDDPEKLFALVGKITEQTDNENVLGMLGAQPVEDLLCEYGEQFTDRVIENARVNERWRYILGCVWIGHAQDERVEEKVNAAIRKYFPDKTP